MCRGYVEVYEELTRASTGGTRIPAQRMEHVSGTEPAGSSQTVADALASTHPAPAATAPRPG